MFLCRTGATAFYSAICLSYPFYSLLSVHHYVVCNQPLQNKRANPLVRNGTGTMRLLNAETLTLEEFVGDEIPLYAILSHTWGKQEVSYEDLQNKTCRNKPSFTKVKGCCDKALDFGCEWVWIDTCCINKGSSAELSEGLSLQN
jgi:hypothetical protein